MVKGLVSVIIASRNEPYLNATIKDVLAKAGDNVEVIAVMDDCVEEGGIEDKRLRYAHHKMHGKRQSMNVGASASNGEYLMFLDAHCMVCEGFDVILKADCDGDWVVAPRRYKLDPEKWERIEEPPKYPVEYMYICDPNKNPNKRAIDGFPWLKRKEERSDPQYDIDDDMIHQGSGWFTTANHYRRMGFMDWYHYGGNLQEAQEVCFTTWFRGGRVVRNKKAWFAHWRKRKGRLWDMDHDEVDKGVAFSTDFWMNNRLKDAIHDLGWLLEKFWPVPTWKEEQVKRLV